MVWEKQKCSKNEVDKAGEILKNRNSSDEDINRATDILNKWRAKHSYPLHIFQMTLRNVSRKYDKKSLAFQRLKRANSIIRKLIRMSDRTPGTTPGLNKGSNHDLSLSDMQDIAGCRAIVKNTETAKKIYQNHYLKGNLKHILVRKRTKDYIAFPKKDGYRSLHLVYEYNSDKGKKEYNGLRVEIQIRSKLQHLWATAVETTDFFTKQAIKFNEGKQDWTDFFRLVSSAFAIKEKCPIIKNTPSDKKKLYGQIKKNEKRLRVIDRMEGWNAAMEFFYKQAKKIQANFFLLELDVEGTALRIRPYSKKEEFKAIIKYSELEQKYRGNEDYDVVLVGVDTVKDLKKAYPNYFADMGDFISELKKIIQ